MSAPRFVLAFLEALADELALMGGQPWALAGFLRAELEADVGDVLIPRSLADAATAAAALASELSGKEPEAVDVDAVVADAAELLSALLELPDALDGWAPPAVGAPALRRALLRLPEVLLLRAATALWPSTVDALVVAGVVTGGVIAPAVDVDRLSALARDPRGTLADIVWPEAFAAVDARILASVARMMRRLGLPTHVTEPWEVVADAAADLGGKRADGDDLKQLTIPFVALGDDAALEANAGLILAPAALKSGGAADGLLLTNYGNVGVSLQLVEPPVTVDATLEIDADRAFVVGAAPGFAAAITNTPTARVELEVTVASAPPADDASVKLGGVRAGMELRSAGPELIVHVETVPAAGERLGLSMQFELPEPDGFLAQIVGGATLTAAADLGLRWSSLHGLSVDAAAGLRFESFPAAEPGPLSLLRSVVALEAGAGGLEASAAVDLRAEIGPITVVVERVGAVATLTRAADGDGSLGSLDVRYGLLAPTGLAISLDSPAVRGGGFVSFDLPTRRYAGMLQLVLMETVGVTAVVEVTTGTPASPRDWSFLMSLSLTFGPIALPYGFFLLGVGGLIGLNRDFDADALGQRLSSGALGSVLFPADPIADAPRVLDDLRTVFPQRTGQHVVGPFVRIGWGGAKPFLQVDLGLLLAFPDTTIGLVANGVLQIPPIGTPIPESAPGFWPVVRLKMAVLGVLDPGERTVWIKGSLYDSQVVGISLSGDTAFYARFDRDPFFLLSVGGFHPDWSPPSALPAAIRSLERLRARFDIADNLYVDVATYFALTTNTLQAGAQFSLVASAKVGPWTFGLEGSSEFHAIAELVPFHINVMWRVDVSILAGSGELLGATLLAQVDGPDPWVVSGHAEFRFLGQDVRVRFEIEGQRGSKALPSEDVLDDIQAALQRPEAWSATPVALATRLHPALESGGGVFAPHADLQVKQDVVPFGVHIDRVGESRPRDGDRFEVTAASLGGGLDVAELDQVMGAFPPARYFDLSGDERLRAPSVEEHPAGVVLTGGWADSHTFVDVSEGWDEQIIDPFYPDDAGPPALEGPGPRADKCALDVKGGPRVVVRPATWTVTLGASSSTHAHFSSAMIAARALGTGARIEEAG